jgi:hypothetical protein
MITSMAMNPENIMRDQSMEVASETRGIQMKKSEQQITAEGRTHVSNEEHLSNLGATPGSGAMWDRDLQQKRGRKTP